MDKAEATIVHDEKSRYFSLDLMEGARAMAMQWWSAQTENGIMGDPTVADPDQGKLFFDAAVRETIGLVQEIRRLQLRPRRDHH
jgi:creatinine amidohydrolase